MIKTYVASTAEVDDEQLAIDQIKSQLNLDDNLLSNSVGIVACHYEFVISGVAQAVCDALPFDVAGTVSNVQSIGDQAGPLLFTVMLITGNDISFKTAVTDSLLEGPFEIISDCYTKTASANPEKPALILTFAPFLLQNSGDEYVAALSEASNGVPCFGTLAVDDTTDFSNCFSICNDMYYPDKMVMILAYGNILPKFYIANISPEKVLDISGIITKSSRHEVMEVNGRPVADFFEELGLTKASEIQYAMTNLPFLFDYNDGTPRVSKIFLALTPERNALFAGAVPEGGVLYSAMTDKDDILLTTGQALDQILEDMKSASGILIYSCVSRFMVIGGDMLGEVNFVHDKMKNQIPMIMAYSGGEICPTKISSDKAINRFHNNTFVACLF